MAITISGENNNDRITAQDGVIDTISGFNIAGIITASSFTGDLTGNVTGNLTGNVNSTSPLLLQTGGSERFRITGNNELGIAGANYGSSGQVLTSGGSGSAVTWSAIPTQVTIANNANDRVITGGSGVNLNGESTLTYGTTGQLKITRTSQSNVGLYVFHSDGNEVGHFGNIGSGNEGILVLKDGGTDTVHINGESGGISYINTGNVGIGTDIPLQRLHVKQGSTTTPAMVEALGAKSHVRFQHNAGDSYTTTIGSKTLGAGNVGLTFDTGYNGAVQRMTIDVNGKVGIGSEIPQAKLDVFATGGTIAQFGDPRTASFECLRIKNNVAGYPAITNDSTPDTLELRSFGSVQATIDSNNNDTGKYFRVMNNGQGGAGTELFRVQEDGKVGIGTNNPTDILDINSDSASAVTNMYLRNHANLGGAALNIWTQGTYSSPTYKAIIGCSDAGGNIRMGAYSNHDLLLLTNNAEKVRITSTGQLRAGDESSSNRTGYRHQFSSTAGSGDVLSLQNPSNSDGQGIGLGFWARNTNNAAIEAAKIKAVIDETQANSTQKGSLRFLTNKDASMGERMQINSAGNVRITGSTHSSSGTSAGNVPLQIVGGGNNVITMFLGNGSTTGNGVNDYSSDIRFNGAGVAWGDISYYPNGNANGGAFRFTGNGSTVASQGNRSLGCSGIFINGTAQAQHLDDYEEGTWTPGITYASGTTVAGSNNYGYYVKIGCLVHLSATIHWTSMNSSPTASYARITGIPFPYKNASAYRSSAILGAQLVGLDGGTSGNIVFGVGSDANNNFIYITPVNLADNGGGNYSHYPTIKTSGTIFGFKIEYMTDS